MLKIISLGKSLELEDYTFLQDFYSRFKVPEGVGKRQVCEILLEEYTKLLKDKLPKCNHRWRLFQDLNNMRTYWYCEHCRKMERKS